MKKKTVRVILDVLLTIMLVFEMFIQYTGNFLHEVVGFAFFATIVVHLALSAKWMKGVARSAKKGRLSMRNGALAAMGVLLAGTMLVLGVSSVAISNILSSAGMTWPLGSYSTWATVHAASSYALCALVAVHLAMHWSFLASAFKVDYDPSRRRAIGAGVHAIAGVGAVALGITAARELLPQADTQVALATESDREAFANVSDRAHESGASSESASSSESSAAKAADPSKSTGGKRHGKGKNGGTDTERAKESSGTSASETTGATPSPGVSEIQGQTESPGSYDTAIASEQNADYYEPETSSEADQFEASGICTLCRKQCPLSAPQCNRPYEAGLI